MIFLDLSVLLILIAVESPVSPSLQEGHVNTPRGSGVLAAVGLEKDPLPPLLFPPRYTALLFWVVSSKKPEMLPYAPWGYPSGFT